MHPRVALLALVATALVMCKGRMREGQTRVSGSAKASASVAEGGSAGNASLAQPSNDTEEPSYLEPDAPDHFCETLSTEAIGASLDPDMDLIANQPVEWPAKIKMSSARRSAYLLVTKAGSVKSFPAKVVTACPPPDAEKESSQVSGLQSCWSFESEDGAHGWYVGARVKATVPGDEERTLELVAGRKGEKREVKWLVVGADGVPEHGAKEPLVSAVRSEALSTGGYIATAQVLGHTYLFQLKPDLTVENQRDYGVGFSPRPQLYFTGSSGVLVTTREVFGHPRLSWAPFHDRTYRLPPAFEGSDRGRAMVAPRLASLGSTRYLLFTTEKERGSRLVAQAVNVNHSPLGPGQFLTPKGVRVEQSAALALDDTRLVVVTSQEGETASSLVARKVRCSAPAH